MTQMRELTSDRRLKGAHLEKLGSDAFEGVSRPLTEPVNGAAVDQARELAQTSPAQGNTRR